MTQPDIRIKYARLLDPFFKDLFEYKKLKGIIDPNKEYPTVETIEDKITEYNDAWVTRQGVLEYIQKVLNLNFRSELLDVYVVGLMKGAISTPTLLGSNNTTELFLDLLTHELIHVLLSDNTQKLDLQVILPRLYPNETPLCRIHIIVHAVMSKVYLEFLKDPSRLNLNIDKDKHFSDYTKSWSIVSEEGYDNIIDNFKTHYLK